MTATYQINASTRPEANDWRCNIYRAGKLVTVKRGRTQAEAVREAVRDVRMCRRGGMLVQLAPLGWATAG